MSDQEHEGDVKEFWGYLLKKFPGMPVEITKANMTTMLTEFIFRVSGFHEHVGNVNVVGLSPSMISPALKKGKLMNNVSRYYLPFSNFPRV